MANNAQCRQIKKTLFQFCTPLSEAQETLAIRDKQGQNSSKNDGVSQGRHEIGDNEVQS